MSTAVEKSQEGAVQTLGQALAKQSRKIQSALPKHVDVNRFLRIALNAYAKNPDLMQCSMSSVIEGIMQSAQLGLTLDGALGQAYLVKYKTVAQFQIGYQGYMELAYRAGNVARFAGAAVYKGDEFKFEYGTKQYLTHVPKGESEDENLTHAYSLVEYKDGYYSFVVVDRARILKSMKASPSGAKGPWGSWFAEMAIKTAHRIHMKQLRLSPETQVAVGLEEQAEAGVEQTFDVDALVLDEEASSASAKVATEARTEVLKDKVTKSKGKVSLDDLTALHECCKAYGWSGETLVNYLGSAYGYESDGDIQAKDLPKIREHIKANPVKK